MNFPLLFRLHCIFIFSTSSIYRKCGIHPFKPSNTDDLLDEAGRLAEGITTFEREQLRRGGVPPREAHPIIAGGPANPSGEPEQPTPRREKTPQLLNKFQAREGNFFKLSGCIICLKSYSHFNKILFSFAEKFCSPC